MKQRHPPSGQQRQRGAVVLVFGLTLVVLIAFAGLAMDLGRFFVIKAELQNAMDACALAAASQLRPGLNDADALNRAVAYGRVFTTGGVPTTELPDFPKSAILNKVNFQSVPVDISSTHISFSPTLGGTYVTGTASFNTANYAKCEYPLAGLPIYFMRVLGLIGLGPFTTQTVSAMAVATGGPQACNVIPAGICERTPSDPVNHGLIEGEWIPIGAKMTAGWFGWVDYSPVAGGTPEVKDGLTAVGQCDLPVVGDPARENGNKASAENAWNTRFGIYSNPYRIADISSIPPDKTGYAYFNNRDPKTGNYYSWVNWPRTDTFTDDVTTPRAYDGTNSPSLNYQSAANAKSGYVQTTTIFKGPTRFATGGSGGQHDLDGRSYRRVVMVPILNCDMQPMPIKGLACVLMLNPFGQDGGDKIDGKLEYLGPASQAPCGNANTTVPNMSVLVK